MTLTEKKQKGWQRSMRLLIDANVILDVLQNREPHVKDSAAIWRLCETRQAEGFISALTFANLVYIMRRELNPGQIEEVLQKTLPHFHLHGIISFRPRLCRTPAVG